MENIGYLSQAFSSVG